MPRIRTGLPVCLVCVLLPGVAVYAIIVLAGTWHCPAPTIKAKSVPYMPIANWSNQLGSSNDQPSEFRVRTERADSCRPQNYVFYLKVPKTGSSTLLAMFQRWVMYRHKTVIPVYRPPLLAKPTHTIKGSLLPLPAGGVERETYNFFGEHFMYDEDELLQYLPNNVSRIASLRFPLTQMRSQIVEAGMAGYWGKVADPMQAALENLPYKKEELQRRTQNHMSRMFGSARVKIGGSASASQSTAGRGALLEFADSRFELVIIQEYFDESLVLLRRKLCWDMRDIIYMPARTRKYAHKENVMPWDTESKHKQWSKTDYEFYLHFKDKLFMEIQKEGDSFQHELTRFRGILYAIHSFCRAVYSKMAANIDILDKFVHTAGYITLDPGLFGNVFNFTQLDCAVLKMHDWAMRSILLIRQYPWLCNTGTDGKFIKKEFCKDLHPPYNISLSSMKNKHIYERLLDPGI